jgi:Predicted metal-dependent phosphoesterases (PHP family)
VSHNADSGDRERVNDPLASREERLAALGRVASGLPPREASGGESNNHVHTIYSFSPYSPSMAALRGREAGLEVAGSVDHDSISASAEMVAACALVGIGSVTGCELRVDFTKASDGSSLPFAERKINNPDSPGIVYMTIQGVRADKASELSAFLEPIRAARLKRTRRMAVSASALLEDAGIPALDFDRDVIGRSKAAEGGGLTERHLLAAVADRMIGRYGRGPALVSGLASDFRIEPSAKLSALIGDPENPMLSYDLLGLLKSGFLERVFEQPGADECPDAIGVVAFARSIGAIPAYAYLGDVGESPTGDKKAEKFEDDFIEGLFDAVKAAGFLAVAYMPPRNTSAQLERVRRLCDDRGLMQISGVDINSPRQSFNCPELRRPEFGNLRDATWALVAHERLSSADSRAGLFSPDNPLSSQPLVDRIRAYAGIGRTLDLSRPEDPGQALDDLMKGRITR